MYVEISGRQTGKTTRLVDHASDELINNINDRNYLIGLVVFNRANGLRIQELIINKFIDKIRYMGYANLVGLTHDARSNNSDVISRLKKKINIQFNMEQPRGGHINKFYVDEFSFIGNDLVINSDAYYCTTPNGNHSFTLHLKNYCENNGVEIIAYDISQELRNEFQMTGYVEEFDNWCIDNQLWMMNHPFEESKRLNERGFIKFNKIKRHKF
jgi:hypothetical protein